MIKEDFNNWEDAYAAGCSIVHKLNRPPREDVQIGLKLARLAAMGLLLGLKEEQVRDFMIVGCEENLERYIKRCTH